MKEVKLTNITVQIRENATGEVIEYPSTIVCDDDGTPNSFIWSNEGNYGCDCNRVLFFKRAKGTYHESDMDAECSDGKYSVNLLTTTNQPFYKEF